MPNDTLRRALPNSFRSAVRGWYPCVDLFGLRCRARARLSGLGAALIFIPLGEATVGRKLIPPVLLLIDGLATLGMIPPAWHSANRRELFAMAGGAALGVPAGTVALALM